jgi:transposase-like protein
VSTKKSGSPTRRRIEWEIKKQIVARMSAGESPSALAREYDVRRPKIYEWKQALDGATKQARGRASAEAASQQRIAELERRVGQLAAENDFFKDVLRRLNELPARSDATPCARPSRKRNAARQTCFHRTALPARTREPRNVLPAAGEKASGDR